MARSAHRRGILAVAALCAGLGAIAGAGVAEVALYRPKLFYYGGDLFSDPWLSRATPLQLVAGALLGAASLPAAALLLRARRAPRILGLLLVRGWAGWPVPPLGGTGVVFAALLGSLVLLFLLLGPEQREGLFGAVAVTTWAPPQVASLLASVCACALVALVLQLEIARHPRQGRRLVAAALTTPALVVVAGLVLRSV